LPSLGDAIANDASVRATTPWENRRTKNIYPRFCRYFVHAPLCVGEAFHGFEPTSILVDGPSEDIEFEGAFHKYKERRIRYQPGRTVELLPASP
jgi:hypothetical protein